MELIYSLISINVIKDRTTVKRFDHTLGILNQKNSTEKKYYIKLLPPINNKSVLVAVDATNKE